MDLSICGDGRGVDRSAPLAHVLDTDYTRSKAGSLHKQLECRGGCLLDADEVAVCQTVGT